MDAEANSQEGKTGNLEGGRIGWSGVNEGRKDRAFSWGMI